MRRALVSIYIDPEFYPPTKNAILCLSTSFEEVVVLTRNLFYSSALDYPANVKFCKIGKLMSVQDSEKLPTTIKMVDFIKFWIYTQFLLLKKFEMVVFYDPIPLFAFFISLKPNRIKYWYHNHDMPDIQLVRKFTIGWFSALFEYRAMKKIDFFSLPSKDRLAYYPNWLNSDYFFYIPNYPLYQQFTHLDFNQRFEDFTIIFQGSIGEGHGIEDLIRVLKELTNVNLILKGSVRQSYKVKIENLVLEHGVTDRVKWVGLTSYSDLIHLTVKCHLGIAIHQGKDSISKTLGTASNKIYEYLACGIPIIVQDNNQFKKNLGNCRAVFYYDGDLSFWQGVVEEVRNHFELYSNIARNEFRDKYTFDKNFETVINQLQYYSKIN